MVSAGYLVEVDWTNTGTWVDITTYVRGETITRGRQRPVDQISPGTLSLDLYNEGGRFTPGNASGAYYPNVKVNRQVRVSVNPSGTRTYLFTGRIDTVSAAWTNGVRPMVTITLTDGFKGLARQSSQSLYAETVLASQPQPVTAFYPLSEAAGATTFGNLGPVATSSAVLTVSKFGAGTFSAGNGVGYLPGAPAATYCTFARTGTGNTEGMTVIQLGGVSGQNGVSLPAGGGWTVGCWFNIAAVPVDNHQLIYARSAPPADPSVSTARAETSLHMTSAGKVMFAVFSPIGSTFVTSAAAYADGKWHYVTASFAADLSTVSLFVDGTAATSTAASLRSMPAQPWIVAGGRYSVWGQSQYGLNGSLSNVELRAGVDTAAGNSARWTVGKQGFATDTGTLTSTVAGNAGFVAGTNLFADTGLTAAVSAFDTTGMTYLAVLQRLADTEQGLLFLRGDGALIFRNRSYRVNQASAFTLNAATQDVAADFTNAVDDSLLFNDYAATRPNGAVVRVRDTTTTSIADNGVYTNAPDANGAQQVYYTTDGEVTDYAAYIVAQYSQPQPRAPKITVDLLRGSSLWSTVQAVELGMRFTVTNLPPEASASSMDLIVESIAWTVDIPGDTVTLSMDTSPADTVMYMTLDDAKYGLLDSNSLYF